MLAGGRDLPGIFQYRHRIVCIPGKKGGKTDDGVHRRPDIMAHIGQEGTLGAVRLFCDLKCLFRGLFGARQHGVGFLKLCIHLFLTAEVFLFLPEQTDTALLPDDGDHDQNQHSHQDERQQKKHPDHGAHHFHGPGGDIFCRYQKEQERVICFQGGKAVVILRAVVSEIRAERIFFGKSLSDIRVLLSLHILQYLKHIVGVDGIFLGDIVVHPCAVAFQDIGFVVAAVSGAVIVFGQSVYVF